MYIQGDHVYPELKWWIIYSIWNHNDPIKRSPILNSGGNTRLMF